MSKKITGTLIWYYYICPREVWLMAHEFDACQDNYFLEMGRFLGEQSYSREKKEIEIGNIKIDLLKRDGKKIVIGEVKKSSKFESSAKMQLAFYLYRLKQAGIRAEGELLIPKEKKKIPVVLNSNTEKELEKAMDEITKIISSETPPEPKKIRFCSKCAYGEFCWV
ncbi:MAG TPA: CRISPR-associated protein Cas4 [Ignavibacteria bacterium]|nr:CRISPR-associated protein Cas4 [Ignavibacteria bacterium]